MLRSLVNKIKKNKKINLVILLCSIFVSLSLLFPAGLLSGSTKIEQTADYLADVAQNHTQNGLYSGLIVEPNDSTDKEITNSVKEFRYLYGIFKERLATYVSTMNATHTHEVHLTQVDSEINFSFLHNDSGNSYKEYNGHYKHEVYPLELMLPADHIKKGGKEELPSGEQYTGFIYISETRARELMPVKGITYDEDNPYNSYKKLLGKYVTVEIDSKEYFYWIESVYLQDNYFSRAINEVVGEFIFCSAYPSNVFKKQALFFLRNYSFQNKFYIDYLSKNYAHSDFNYHLLRYNIEDNFTIDESKLVFYSESSDAGSVVLVVFSVLLALIGLVTFYISDFNKTLMYHLLVGAALLSPYLIFLIIHFVSKSVLLFSSFSTIWEFGVVLFFVLCYILILLIKRDKPLLLVSRGLGAYNE